ncbi:MAG: helix-turn-helix domain-containing protein [Sheuella sp.]|nr:helix-turn-helix domain-containing protein [Sheuella sp.]
MTSSKHSLMYLRFLNLINAVRQIPTFPNLDPVEERLLNQLAATWHVGKKISVLEAMGLSTEISATTAHRRLKTLLKKGMIALNPDQTDSRIKYVVPTDLTTQYFTSIGQALEQAQRAE